MHPYMVMDIPREIIENIPVVDGKPDELNQFLSTINSYATMYNMQRVNLVMLRTRGKAHEIVSHAVAEDPDVEWSTISKKLISNYGTIIGNIKDNVKITKLQMKDDEPLGEYLAQARTLIKTKLKNPLQWHTEYNDTDAFHVCNGLNKPRLKYHKLSRIHKMDSYKDLFANIKEEWSHGYFIEKNFTEEPKQEMNKIQCWDEQAPKDPQEALMYAEINYVYHKHGRQPPPYTLYQEPRPQGSGHPFTRGRGGGPQSGMLQPPGPRQSSTTIANQAYTFNGPTAHPHLSYGPGNLSMSPMVLPTPYTAPYAPLYDQYQHYQQQPQYNTFAK